MTALRSILADNPGPFTLEGTRTYILGLRQAAIIDPGPALRPHLEALVRSVEGTAEIRVLLTHGHRDHTGGAELLLEGLRQAGHSPLLLGSGRPDARPLAEGEVVPTDAGELVAVPTPGHARDHLSFHWPDGRALFAGDMVLGRGDTTWVAEYPGCVADYLQSLDRLEAMELDVIYPSHGPDIDDPAGTLARYRAHREGRIARVREILADEPEAQVRRVLERVYGGRVPEGLLGAALASADALVEYVTGKPREGRGMTEPQG